MGLPAELVLRDTVPADRERLLELKCRSFAGLVRANEERRFDWEFRDNPALRADRPWGAVALVDGELAGAFCYVPHRVWIGGREGYGGAACDLSVEPRFRGRGLGAELSATLWADGWCDFPFGTGTNAASLHLFTALGATLLGGRAETTAYAWFIRDAHPPLPEGPRLEVEEAAEFGAGEDALWERVRRHHRLMLVKDSIYLNWRYRDFPFGGVRLLRAVGEAGRVRGVAAVAYDPAHDRMFLLDWLAEPDDEPPLRGLLRRAIELARETELEALYVATRDPRQEPLLGEHDFRPIPGDVPTYIARLFPPSLERGVRVADWSSALGDGDQLYNAGEPRPAREEPDG